MGGKPGKLTAKQKAFVREYLLCRNGAEAARRAGYPPESARQMAEENLTKPDILKLVEEGEKKAQEKFEVSQQRIIEGLAAIAFFDPAEALEWSKKGGVRWKDSKKLEKRITSALDIWGSPGKSGTGSVSLRNVGRDRALELLGKHVGMWRPVKDDPNGSGEGSSEGNRQSVLKRVSELMRKRARRGEPPSDSGA